MAAPLPTATTGSPAREREAALLAHCVATAGGIARTDSVGLARLHQLAASLLQERAPDAAARLRASVQSVLCADSVPAPGSVGDGTAALSLTELREQGWIVDLPRFRRQLFQALRLTC